jgi:putative sporulation protein YyaC
MKVTKEKTKEAIIKTFPKDMTTENTVFVCVGTDRSTGDSLGPLLGTKLKKRGYQVYGTIHEPVHAMNLKETVLKIHRKHEGKYVVAIDACLGQISSVGMIQVGEGPVRPGAGVNKDLPPVGTHHITGIVNVGGFMEFFVLQNTRLSLVMDLTDAIYDGISKRFPIKKTRKLFTASYEG